MHLKGSCHCGAVRFSLESDTPVPFQRCYCGICRKVGGGGGYLVNLGGDADTLQVQGRAHLQTYRAVVERDGKPAESAHARHFCGRCGCHLWAQHDRWPKLVHPVAGAIDTPLPAPTSHRHMMLASKADWVTVVGQAGDEYADAYPTSSLAQWHAEHHPPNVDDR